MASNGVFVVHLAPTFDREFAQRKMKEDHPDLVSSTFPPVSRLQSVKDKREKQGQLFAYNGMQEYRRKDAHNGEGHF